MRPFANKDVSLFIAPQAIMYIMGVCFSGIVRECAGII